MTTETIDHTTLSKLAEAGVVRSAHAVGQAGGWGILVKYGMTERALTAQRSHQVRIFRKLETLVGYLKGLGIPRFDVDAANFDPVGGNVYKRPDTSETLKKAHEAAAYDKWFRTQVQEALDDPRPAISNEDMEAEFSALHAELAAEAVAMKKIRG
jgi:hypothetical protein